jgi:glycosyltransferase involved in cell wall biosynthesis
MTTVGAESTRSLPSSIDFFTRKPMFAVLQLSLGLAYASTWLFSRAFTRRRRPTTVRSIAAVWYWPPDLPSASRTRLGAWTRLFADDGVRFDNYYVGSMEELQSDFEGGSWTSRYWFYTKLLWKRWRQFFALRPYDVVWIDRWFLPHYPLRRPLFEGCLRRMVPHLVIDSSDGSDYQGNPHLVLGVMSLADKVTVAYKGLYDFYAARFPRVVRFEYPILQAGYRVRKDHSAPSRFTLGWMGSPSSYAYLKDIEGELRAVAAQHPFRLVVICRRPGNLDIPGAEVSYYPFGDDYFDLIASCDIGLVPFTVADFSTTGKIAMKHQEFLLCAVPQICSAAGISEHAVDGEHVLVAAKREDWAPALLRLMRDDELRARLGRNGRELCLRYYTLEGQWPVVRNALTTFD